MPNYQRWKDIMKCYPLEEKRLLRYPKPWLVQPKYDGERCRAKYNHHTDQWLLYSSEANLITSVPHIITAIENSDITSDYELDGELYCHGLPLSEIQSIVSRTVNPRSDFRKIEYFIFDIVNESLRQDERLKLLRKFSFSSPLCLVPTWETYELSQVYELFETLTKPQKHGYEGIVVRSPHNFYKRTRSTEVMKYKPRKHDIYRIVGFKQEHDIHGHPKDSLGAFICDSGSESISTFDVGTGFTRAQRQKYWELRTELINQHILISYQQLTSRNKVPCFATFLEIVNNEC